MTQDKPKDRLRKARVSAGYETAADFAAAMRNAGRAVTNEAYRHHENGTRNIKPDVAELYAPLLKVTPQFLLFGDPKTSGTGNIRNSLTVRTADFAKTVQSALSRDKIEVLGMAECGPDGWALWNGDVVDVIDRPPQLAGAPTAYAVFITGDSMEPKYSASDIAYIHPGKPITAHAYVLVQIHPIQEGEPPRAVIKRLVRRSGDKIILEQFNPPKTFTLKAREILSIHRVVLSGEP